ncbi:MAG: hypothetical protein ACLGSD_07935 [Acidobacteriota bacterium]
MKSLFAGVLTASTMVCVALARSTAQTPADPPAHIVSTFSFEIAAPMAQIAPLFAPEAERRWAGKHWNPIFAWPLPGKDVQGAVFTTKHGPFDAVWVNTRFDPPAGRMQYVCVLPGIFATIVDVRVIALARSRTRVNVTYTRTSLDPAANDEVRHLAQKDRASAPEWRQGIEAALGLRPQNP